MKVKKSIKSIIIKGVSIYLVCMLSLVGFGVYKTYSLQKNRQYTIGEVSESGLVHKGLSIKILVNRIYICYDLLSHFIHIFTSVPLDQNIHYSSQNT
ncbi:hypothetical protein FUAX_53620 (plasmid) [Fulvitalea axinellae]|uniref:Uncharacterized protein n=1 Tax=Fulvitalea axinellae TaxID=1182444 RepID=A0AAU9DK72_9BACT|nr:hypothetical protein FUAX_53620 [Fulvitalea axinellae]